ncbi:MAG: PEP-CTERM system histidine kinase PrsK, partial [Rubrivivax sp.]|nr:PEP-CTERM system histidine kinase PrsK [Rubrivivax sp.]
MLAYLGLSGLIVASWQQRPQGRLLVLATGLSALWGALAAAAAWGVLPVRLELAAEVARNGAWLALLLYILRLRLPPGGALPAPLRLIRALAIVLVGGLLLAGVAPLIAPDLPLLAQWASHLGRVLLTVLGLVLIEQVYRSTRQEDRWAIKFLCLGLGGLFIYDFYLYANAALFNALDANVWAARGYVAALVTPLIAVSAARNPEWSAPVGLSRSMVFHTASLLGAGIYLLLMAG